MGIFDPPAPTHLCRSCGNRVKPLVASKLNGCFFVVLLCFFIVPGLLYLVWALTQHVVKCPSCGAVNSVIPLNSPEAARALSVRDTPKLTTSRKEKACPWCAEPILVEAKFCKHCHRDVDS